MRIIVLGAGRVGEAIARDLAAGGRFELTVADISQLALDRCAAVEGLTTVRADLVAVARSPALSWATTWWSAR